MSRHKCKNYFSGNKELFKGLAIENLEKEWKKHPIFHVDFNGSDFTVDNALHNRILSYLEKWERQYNVSPSLREDIGTRFSNVLEAAHEQTGLGCVVLVDEYDKPMLDVLDSNFMVDVDGNKISIEDKNRETLKAFYSTFKLADKHLRFVFLTGDLIRLLNHFKEDLNELTNRYYAKSQFYDYKADKEEPLPMIYQSGYLTIKDYREERKTFLLDFPIDEVRRDFLSPIYLDTTTVFPELERIN